MADLPSFIEMRFPEKYGRPVRGGPEFQTVVNITSGGREKRNIGWDEFISRYSIAHLIKKEEPFREIQAFHVNMRGRGIGFRHKDILDFQATLSVIGIGDDTQTPFQLVQRYGVLLKGQARAGGASTIQLATDHPEFSLYNSNSSFVGNYIQIVGGAGAGQARLVSSYNGSSKTVTVAQAWTTPPDATSLYEIEVVAYDKPRLKPVAGTITIFDHDGASISASVAVTTGLVTPTANWPLDQVIRATFQFDVPVRFDQDFQNASFSSINSRNWPNIGLQEILNP